MCNHVVDVSEHQGKMNWARAANAGVCLAITRVTLGAGKVDARFAENQKGILDQGIRWGGYHVFRPEVSGTDQAYFFRDVLLVAGGFEPYLVALDVEVNASGVSKAKFWENLLVCAITLDECFRGKVMVYTNKYFWNRNVGSAPWPMGRLWIANYTTAPKPGLPYSWTDWSLWQYSANGNKRGGEFGAESWDIDLSRASFRLAVTA